MNFDQNYHCQRVVFWKVSTKTYSSSIAAAKTASVSTEALDLISITLMITA